MMLVLSIICLLLAVVCLLLIVRLRQNRRQIAQAMVVLEDIGEGNLDRKIVVDENSDIAALCFRLNEIVSEIKTSRSEIKQATDELYKLLDDFVSTTSEADTGLPYLLYLLSLQQRYNHIGDPPVYPHTYLEN